MPEVHPAVHDDFVTHSRTVGHPSEALPQIVREAYVAAGLTPPRTVNLQLSVVTPPPAESNRCCHCGTEVEPGQHERWHAVAGFEDAAHPASGLPLRMRVVHCAACLDSEACSPDTPTPGAGAAPGEPAGFCHE